ncbi:phosphopyruvate hydratase [Patescibacteria group bacterium]|nr:phosphopyruvate hydratase [Patescibacteria group bacterium]
MTLSALTARPVLTSRGTWTVEVTARLSDGSVGVAAVPEGKSAGSHEVPAVTPTQAIQHIEGEISDALTGIVLDAHTRVDSILRELDGTDNFARLGGNTTLAVSVATAKAFACKQGVPLWHYLAGVAGTSPGYPKLLANLINGGVHAGSGLPYQEYLISPQVAHPEYAIHMTARFYLALGELLAERFGPHATALGDEGGYTPPCEDPAEPYHLFDEVRERLQLEPEFLCYGLDAAANEIEEQATYVTRERYQALAEAHPLCYLEDPFTEDDLESHAALKASVPERTRIIGDDVTTTNVHRMSAAREADALSGLIIKPNQIGTLTDTLHAIARAREYDWSVTVSHRSGETTDPFIADLAVAVAADSFKLGAPARGERVEKYNRLLAIVEERVGQA